MTGYLEIYVFLFECYLSGNHSQRKTYDLKVNVISFQLFRWLLKKKTNASEENIMRLTGKVKN